MVTGACCRGTTCAPRRTRAGCWVCSTSVAGASTRGLLYTHELRRRGRLSHRLSVGIDDRRFDNDLVFAGSDIAPPPVRSRPVTLGYGAGYAGEDWGGDVWVQYARSMKSGGGNTDGVYGRNRAGAKAGWDALRGGGALTWSIVERWSVRAVFEGQMANEAMIAGEQFGLGGVHSVRGFSERELAGDDGIRGSVELWSPAQPALGLRYVLFADAGRVFNEPGGHLARRDSIGSVGGGGALERERAGGIAHRCRGGRWGDHHARAWPSRSPELAGAVLRRGPRSRMG